MTISGVKGPCVIIIQCYFITMIKVLKLQYDNIMTLCIINIVSIIKQTCYVIIITMSYNI